MNAFDCSTRDDASGTRKERFVEKLVNQIVRAEVVCERRLLDKE